MNIKPLILLVLFIATLTGYSAYCKTIRVAVIDTGFGFNGLAHDVKLCKYGHKDFTSAQEYSMEYDTIDPIPVDRHGHGTNIAGAINKYAKNADFCLIILKFYKDIRGTNAENLEASVQAFRYAINIKVDIINYSGGGNRGSETERNLVKKFIDNGGTIVAAAGNASENLDLLGNYFYPAMYDDRIIVVGNKEIVSFGKTKMKRRSPTSNYGSVVKYWEVGTVDMYGYSMSGTSQSTALKTGKIINERFRKSKRENNFIRR